MAEKYVLECPSCGRVEGYAPSLSDDREDDFGDADAVIEEAEVQTSHGPGVRARCPRCGRWCRTDCEHAA